MDQIKESIRHAIPHTSYTGFTENFQSHSYPSHNISSNPIHIENLQAFNHHQNKQLKKFDMSGVDKVIEEIRSVRTKYQSNRLSHQNSNSGHNSQKQNNSMISDLFLEAKNEVKEKSSPSVHHDVDSRNQIHSNIYESNKIELPLVNTNYTSVELGAHSEKEKPSNLLKHFDYHSEKPNDLKKIENNQITIIETQSYSGMMPPEQQKNEYTMQTVNIYKPIPLHQTDQTHQFSKNEDSYLNYDVSHPKINHNFSGGTYDDFLKKFENPGNHFSSADVVPVTYTFDHAPNATFQTYDIFNNINMKSADTPKHNKNENPVQVAQSPNKEVNGLSYFKVEAFKDSPSYVHSSNTSLASSAQKEYDPNFQFDFKVQEY